MEAIKIYVVFLCVMFLTSCGTFKYRATGEVKVKSLPYTHFYLANQKSKPMEDGYMKDMGALDSKEAEGVIEYLGSSDAEGNAVLTLSTKAYKRAEENIYAMKNGFEPQKFKLHKRFNTLVLLDIIYPLAFLFDKYTILDKKEVNELYLNQESNYDCFDYLEMARKEQDEEKQKELLWLTISQDYMNEYGIKAIALTALADMEVEDKNYHNAYLLLKEIKRHDPDYDISEQLNALQAYVDDKNQKIQRKLDRLAMATSIMSAVGNSLSATSQSMNTIQGGNYYSQGEAYNSVVSDNDNDASTRASNNNYQAEYDKWAKLAERHYNSIVNTGGVNVTDKDGNLKGGIAAKRSAGNYTAIKRSYNQAQLKMRNIRRKAEAKGIKIVVSQWENMQIKPGEFSGVPDPY